jgi:hypothetical protein
MPTHNSTYPKVAVQWLNQALCFYQSLCLVDSEPRRIIIQRGEVLADAAVSTSRNRHLRVAAKRCRAFKTDYEVQEL